MGNLFQGYAPESFFDEMFDPSGSVRSHYDKLLARYTGMSSEEFQKKRDLADTAFLTPYAGGDLLLWCSYTLSESPA